MCTVVNKYKDGYDIYIGRGSVWGNDYSHLPETKASHKVETRDEAVDAYRNQLWDSIRSGTITVEMLKSLHGKRLGCFCKPKSCHGDIIVKAVEWAMKR
jgi:hypothetical protein